MHDEVTVGLIYGSTREGRLCDAVAGWAGERIWNRSDFLLEPVDPAMLALPSWHEREAGAEVVGLRQRLDRADAFVVVTPEYNHSYPAALKFVIDSASAEWRAKPVAFVSYGGVSGGVRAVEHLRLVFAELHAVTVRDAVSFTHVWDWLDANGELNPPERAGHAMTRLLAQLRWWAHALREAREAAPYERAVA